MIRDRDRMLARIGLLEQLLDEAVQEYVAHRAWVCEHRHPNDPRCSCGLDDYLLRAHLALQPVVHR